jgi:hypothetical protein
MIVSWGVAMNGRTVAPTWDRVKNGLGIRLSIQASLTEFSRPAAKLNGVRSSSGRSRP